MKPMSPVAVMGSGPPGEGQQEGWEFESTCGDPKEGEILKTFPNLDSFYDDNPLRLRSEQAHYGYWWTDDSPAVRWRVSYIQDTGEVYAVADTIGEGMKLLGVVPLGARKVSALRTLDKLMEGWRELPHRELSWVRHRLELAGYRPKEER